MPYFFLVRLLMNPHVLLCTAWGSVQFHRAKLIQLLWFLLHADSVISLAFGYMVLKAKLVRYSREESSSMQFDAAVYRYRLDGQQ